ncbi:T9SS type A sorting domain-containing protein [Aequorivita todarodis]|uniref:T9SS type A sorting domain-containing protein n=1 Tax=Aequorivita todarodis TaxID=2036821 RepID=UPI00235100BC|nr:T9SS type A sorting domain-containing protein [Aequorivita todarodis]MDC8001422.1 T9SS type A sorting domain-containing protein [Aequorivita todarodis]
MNAFFLNSNILSKGFPSLIFLFWTSCIIAQPDIIWQNSLGGTLNDEAQSSAVTEDGGIILAGFTESNDGNVTGNHGGKDYWVVKLDASGVLEWEKAFGGSADDRANSIIQTADGGYMVAGSTASNDGDVSSNHGSRDFWVLKLDSAGNIVWEQTYGGTNNDDAQAIIQTADGGYMVAGNSYSSNGDVGANNGIQDYWMVKIDPAGAIEWENNYGGSAIEYVWAIKQTSDNGYILVGDSESSDGDVSGNQGLSDYWIVKTDSFGALQWQHDYGGSERERPKDVIQTDDGGYLVVGASESSDGDIGNHYDWYDVWILKLDASGNLDWEKSYGGSFGDFGEAIIPTDAGNYLIGTSSQSSDGDVGNNHGNFDCWVFQINATGNIAWERSYGGSHHDYINAIGLNDSGNLLFAGYSYSDDGEITGNHGASDFISIQLESLLSSPEVSIVPIELYPNPVANSLNIKSGVPVTEISISNLLGQQVFYKRDTDISSLNLENLSKGAYFLTATLQEGRTFTQKILKQ